MAVSVKLAMILSLLMLTGAAKFTADHCRLMRIMRVNGVEVFCSEHREVLGVTKVSPRAQDASYAPQLSVGPTQGRVSNASVNGGPAAGHPADSGGAVSGGVDGVGGPGPGSPPSGAGGPSTPSAPEKPGGGGGGGVRPGDRPPIDILPGKVVVKPGGGTIVIGGDGRPGIFDGKIDSKEEVRRLIILRRRGGSDYTPPNEPDRPGKPHEGRNSR
jgi:hypothetical protein